MSGPTASRIAPICLLVCLTRSVGAFWSLDPANMLPIIDGFSPGKMILVLNAV